MQIFKLSGQASYSFELEVWSETLEDAEKLARESVTLTVKSSIRANDVIDYDMPYKMDSIEYSEK